MLIANVRFTRRSEPCVRKKDAGLFFGTQDLLTLALRYGMMKKEDTKEDGAEIMREELMEKLRVITPEEKKLLSGEENVDRTLYTSGKDFTVDSRKMLERGELINVRPHTRFAHFPEHRHNYVEVLYTCEGSITNIIGGKEVVVKKGELLFLNQFTHHEILPAGQEDIAINFIILPDFFDVAYEMIGSSNVLTDFLVNLLRKDEERGEFLHFRVSEVLQIQNLLENMIDSLVSGKQGQNRINQITMGLLFLYLSESVQYAETRVPDRYENMMVMTVLEYIEQNYRTASLSELCERLHLPMHTLSRMIKRGTGANFKELLQRKRLNKAVQLLCDTSLPVNDIIAAVGYENNSYFHRVFRERYQLTPKEFRKKNQTTGQIRL